PASIAAQHRLGSAATGPSRRCGCHYPAGAAAHPGLDWARLRYFPAPQYRPMDHAGRPSPLRQRSARRVPGMSGPIACFVRSLGGGGAQRAMVRLASALAEQGHAVTLLTLHPHGPFRRELSPAVTLLPLPGRRLIGALPALVHYLTRQRPQVIFTTEP